MKISKKDSINERVILNLDRKNLSIFFKELKKLGKKLEYNSNQSHIKYMAITNSLRIPYMKVRGYSSKCEDNTHIGLFDWDNCNFEDVVVNDCLNLINIEKTSPIIILSTKENYDKDNNQYYGNYMGICVDKRYFWEWVEIMKKLHTDSAHWIVASSYKWKEFVLRGGDKNGKNSYREPPRFKCIIGDKSKLINNLVSRAHIEMLRKMYPEIPKLNYRNMDNGSKIIVADYSTGSGGR